MLGICIVLSACEEQSVNPNKQLRLSAFEEMKVDEYALNAQQIRERLEHICIADKDSATADFRVRRYYRAEGPMVWVDRHGADSRADTLLSWLKRELSPMGFSERAFGLSQIESDLDRMRSLTFDAQNTINDVAARLEYGLTKAYLRYVMGQRFGFADPFTLFNRLDVQTTDTLGNPTSYARLFDVDMQRPGKNYAQLALHKVMADSLGEYLAECQPDDSIYQRLLSELPAAKGQYRQKLLCNMERRRWRERKRPMGGQRYVLVNVAAYHLWAVSPDTVVEMRVGCGASHTKTPLLTSYFTRMDVNPEWIIPMSIVHKDMLKHAGDPSYFNRHGYYIAERKTGQRMDISAVTEEMLASGQYRVTQPGGAGNALGRIIFRFPNNFSVFLHDTSSRGFFANDNRGVSHGCVRVQKPYELAKFLLVDANEWMLDKLRITMGLPPLSEQGIEYMAKEDRPQYPSFMRSLDVRARVPLYITYYTIYPDPVNGTLQAYPDVYHYDRALTRELRWYQ